jgi:hypothetical protein
MNDFQYILNQKIMKRSSFLFISAILTLVFGTLLFFIPTLSTQSLDMIYSPETGSVLRSMGGLIIGSGTINLFLRNSDNNHSLKALLLANIITHTFGLLANVWGLADGAITICKIAPFEINLFVGIGSVIYLLQLKRENV